MLIRLAARVAKRSIRRHGDGNESRLGVVRLVDRFAISGLICGLSVRGQK
jgi:hypothetical protein